MKRFYIKALVPLVLVWASLAAGTVSAAEMASPPPPASAAPDAAQSPVPEVSPTPLTPGDKEYEATVLLIDHEAGLLGVNVLYYETQKEEKRSFKVDKHDVFIGNPLNQQLEFDDIAAGDMLDIYTRVDSDGREAVLEIMDYSHFKESE